MPKQVSIIVHFFVSGSYMDSWRMLTSSGSFFAKILFEPSLQYAGSAFARIAEVTHTRPFSSIIGLWGLLVAVQST